MRRAKFCFRFFPFMHTTAQTGEHMSSSDDLIAAFTGVTGASAAEAKSYLEASNWDKNVRWKGLMRDFD